MHRPAWTFAAALLLTAPASALIFPIDPAALSATVRAEFLRAQSSGAATPAPEAVAARVATLPEATASFGAVVSDGWLYVYGGHVSPTHNYSVDAVSGRFSRLKLADMRTWEALPPGPTVQGMNLAAHGGKVYRVGGMQPRNKAGEREDMYSVADVSVFDPARGRWDALPPLPTPRSSHDVVVIGNQLFVVGGWTQKGQEKTTWPSTMEVLDLSAKTPAWRSVPQPFTRRAYIAAAQQDRLYVLGGFDERSQVVRDVSIYDATRQVWSEGPALPGGPMNGFGPAAAVIDGRLYVSVDDGSVHRMKADASGWEPVGRATPRIVHRMLPAGDRLLIVGGAAGGKNSDLVEELKVR